MHLQRFTILSAMALALLICGCQPETRVVRSSWDNFPADPKPSQSHDPEAYRDPAGGQGWAIQVIQFTGNDRHDKARDLIQHLRGKASLAELWIEDLGDTATIYHGRFASVSAPSIRPAMAKVKTIQIEGEKPFTQCKLVALIGDGRVIADPFDLRQFIGYYSLQIGFYDRAFEGDFRAAAEQAVRSLREDGFEAYYYHGPFRSIIAIGVFSYDQAFVSAGTHDTYAPHIHKLQEQFPFNLGNGSTILQKVGGRDLGEQKSSLIRVF
jgi:hypothetical protein